MHACMPACHHAGMACHLDMHGPPRALAAMVSCMRCCNEACAPVPGFLHGSPHPRRPLQPTVINPVFLRTSHLQPVLVPSPFGVSRAPPPSTCPSPAHHPASRRTARAGRCAARFKRPSRIGSMDGCIQSLKTCDTLTCVCALHASRGVAQVPPAKGSGSFSERRLRARLIWAASRVGWSLPHGVWRA